MSFNEFVDIDKKTIDINCKTNKIKCLIINRQFCFQK